VVCYETRTDEAASKTGASFPTLAMDYQANAFAAALLMPAAAVRAAAGEQARETPAAGGEILVEKLARRFEVPRVAMAHRLMQLALVLA
jgi:Zn-dependent peptidase ImmA (M78 family)